MGIGELAPVVDVPRAAPKPAVKLQARILEGRIAKSNASLWASKVERFLKAGTFAASGRPGGVFGRLWSDFPTAPTSVCTPLACLSGCLAASPAVMEERKGA